MQERYEKFYKSNFKNSYGFWHKVINRGKKQIKILRNTIFEINSKSIKILDVGCGAGDEMKEAISDLDKNIKIIANDTSQEVLDIYRKNLTDAVIETKNCRLERLPEC